MIKTLIIIALALIIILLTIIIIKLFSNSPKAKGKQGEKQVAKYLSNLPSKKYVILNDILLQNNVHSTQIDHIVFSVYGIFVIETKNYSGIIRGKENSENWTKETYGNKFPFRNPILQNKAHIKALQRILSIKDEKKIIPIVTFSKRAKLKIHTSSKVVYYNKVDKVILRYRKKVFYKSEIARFVDRIENMSISNSHKAQKDHIKRIHEKEERNSKPVCPRCGRPIIEKRDRFGKFLACSNYPRCKFRQDLKTHRNSLNHHRKRNLHQMRKRNY